MVEEKLLPSSVPRNMRKPKDVIAMVDGEIGTFTSISITIKPNVHTATNTAVGITKELFHSASNKNLNEL